MKEIVKAIERMSVKLDRIITLLEEQKTREMNTRLTTNAYSPHVFPPTYRSANGD